MNSETSILNASRQIAINLRTPGGLNRSSPLSNRRRVGSPAQRRGKVLVKQLGATKTSATGRQPKPTSMENSAVEIEFRLYATERPSGDRGSSDTPRSGKGRLPRVTQVMALAIHFQDMIQRGEARDYADLARLGCLTRERMSQIMELAT